MMPDIKDTLLNESQLMSVSEADRVWEGTGRR
jgi:hypothetical protein